MNSKKLKQLDYLIDTFVSKEWQDMLQHHSHQLTFHKGELILKEGGKADRIYMVKNGRVKVFSNYTAKTEVILRFATNGQILGHRGFGEDFTFSISALALDETEVISFPQSLFQSVLKANSEFCYYILMFFAEELKRSERMRKNQLNMTVKERVAQGIRMNFESFGYAEGSQILALTVSRKDLAALASTSYESVIRSLTDLQYQGIIKIHGKQIEILNEDALCEMTICSQDISPN